ncbi:unnamed protein product [Peniophora sp. CBMAI 1063]|nr:unnamed protein product [Peniophora sp. CBMAI 1063]
MKRAPALGTPVSQPCMSSMLALDEVHGVGDTEANTCRRLRGLPPCIDHQISTRVCLRLVLSHPGRLLWKFKTAPELIQAMISVVEAHQALCVKGILHRDISAENVMLRAEHDLSELDVLTSAFLTDVDYAEMAEDDTNALTLPKKMPRSPAMTGTLQFHARDVLESISGSHEGAIPKTAHHDVESFTLVIAYAVLKHLEERFSRACNMFPTRVPGSDNHDSGENAQVGLDHRKEKAESESDEDFGQEVTDESGAAELSNLIDSMSPGDEPSIGDEELNIRTVAPTAAEAWIGHAFSQAFGKEFVEDILQARKNRTAFDCCENPTATRAPTEVLEYFATEDGYRLRRLLLLFANLFNDDQTRRLRMSTLVDTRVTEAWEVDLTAASGNYRSYQEYFSYQSLLDVLKHVLAL